MNCRAAYSVAAPVPPFPGFIAPWLAKLDSSTVRSTLVATSFSAMWIGGAGSARSCAALCEAGWIRIAGERQGGSKGRRSSDFQVNPAIYTPALAKMILGVSADSANSASHRPNGTNGPNGTGV
jgi:hypothetical protein